MLSRLPFRQRVAPPQPLQIPSGPPCLNDFWAALPRPALGLSGPLFLGLILQAGPFFFQAASQAANSRWMAMSFSRTGFGHSLSRW